MFEEKVTVVEDDAQIRNFVTYALEREGFKVIFTEIGVGYRMKEG